MKAVSIKVTKSIKAKIEKMSGRRNLSQGELLVMAAINYVRGVPHLSSCSSTKKSA